MTKCFLVQGLLVAAILLGGCAGGVGASAPGSFGPSVSPAAAPAPFVRAFAGSQRDVFVAGMADAVVFYSANIHEKNPPALGEINQGVTRAQGLWIDRRGTLYVSNNTWPPSIAEYKRGTAAPIKVITNGLNTPGAVAVDSAGNLYVANTNQTVIVYPPGASSPSRTIQLPNQGRSSPGGLAFGPHGNLLVATFDIEHQVGNLYSVAPGSSQPVNLNLHGLSGSALGTDQGGNIYVGGDEGYISVFAPGSKTPSRSINAGDTGFYSDLTVTPNGTVYWPNYDLGEMYEFAPGASAPTNIFAGGGVDAAVGAW
jgi:hypothetical protein